MRKKLVKRLGAGMLGLAMVVSSIPCFGAWKEAPTVAVRAAEETSNITINGDDIQADNVNGLTFKGFGMLCANSTSDLLLDYKAEQPQAYAQMMQYLFGGEYPIMNHVKLEMGNDSNNSTGPEAATKRTAQEETNVRRQAAWQIAADAKKINPNLKVSLLCWNTPKWVKTDEDKYSWYRDAILKAYEEYGYMVNYINPNRNEAWGGASDVAYTKKFAELIASETEETIPDATARALFQQIKLVVSDEASTVNAEVAEYMKKDEAFYNAVSVVGYHYSPEDDANGGMKWLADIEDKEVWNSEAQATFSNSAFRPVNNVKDPSVAGTGIGGNGSALEMGNTFIKGLVNSRRSHVIYQPAIGSFYEGAEYCYKELISARDPWSGWMHYDAGLLVLAHVSKFAKTGWENEDNTAGIWRAVTTGSISTAEGVNPVNGRNGGDNYMTLAAPTKDNFSTFIVNDSEYKKSYKIGVENMSLSEGQTLKIWETSASNEGAFNENYMKYLGEVTQGEDGTYQVVLPPYSCVTVTTLDMNESEEHTNPLPVEGERTVLDTDSTGDVQNMTDDYLYADDFDYTGKTVPVLDENGEITEETEDYIASRGGDTGAIARYTHTTNGAFEVYKTTEGKYVLRQQVDKTVTGVGSAWNTGDPMTTIGDFRWTNYSASVDALFEGTENEPYAMIGIRQTAAEQNGHRVANSCGYSLKLFQTGVWELYRQNKVMSTGTITAADGFKEGANVWNNLKLVGEGNIIHAYINDVLVATYEDASPITSGRIALGSEQVYTQFDNLEIKTIQEQVPYYTEFLDNMEMYDLTAEMNAKLVYNDKWNHSCGQGKYVYQRTISENTEAGASLTYTFTGTGLEILGKNDGSAVLKVSIDGTVVAENASTLKSKVMNTTYSLKGLEYKEHTVTIEIIEGSLSLDMLGILGAPYGVIIATPEPSPTTSAPAAPTPTVSAPAVPAPTNPTVTEAPKKEGDIVGNSDATYVITDTKKREVACYKVDENIGGQSTEICIADSIGVYENGEEVMYKVTAICDNAFVNQKKLKSVIIGKHVTSIGKNAFKGCKKLKKIKIKSTSLKKIGKNAFQGIHKKAVFTCKKKNVKNYKKKLNAKTGFKKTMKVKKG